MPPIRSVGILHSNSAGELHIPHYAPKFGMRSNFRNYDHVAGLWKHEDWLPQTAVALARAHYAAYMVKRVDGLRIITLNTDMCTALVMYNVERRSS
jgi:hypothetical protein